MKLFRYFAALALEIVGVTWLALAIMVVAVNLIENVGTLSKVNNSLLTALHLSAYSAITQGYQVLPIAVFLGVLVAGVLLARRGEFLAVQAAGIGPLVLHGAFFSVAVAVSAAGIAAGEYAVPWALRNLERVQREELGRVDDLTRFYNRQLHWYREGDMLIFVPSVDVEAGVFGDVTVYMLDKGLITQFIDADRLVYVEAAWYLESGHVRGVDRSVQTAFARMPISLHIQPADLVEIASDPRQLPAHEIQRLIKQRKAAGLDATTHAIELHSRFAFPLLAAWLFALVAPWTLHPDQRRSLAVALGWAAVVVAVLLSLTQVFRLLALAHKIPTPLGAWGVSLVCLVLVPLSFLAYQRFRQTGSLF
jgi:LPS export ABC transporter permease LptG